MPNVQTELGISANYALLSYGGLTNTGSSVITGGNGGAFPTASYTGFPPGVFTPPAAIDSGNAAASRVAGNLAFIYYQGLASNQTLTSNSDMGAQQGQGSAVNGTYLAGVYTTASGMLISTAITLDAQGNKNALFVFQAGSTITQALAGTVTLVNGAQANNVIWVVGSSFTSTTGAAVMVGNILAYASITLGGGTLAGRALAVGGGNGAITISSALTITVPAFSSNVPPSPTPGPGFPSVQCLISRNLGSSVATAWPQVTGPNGPLNLDLLQIVNQGEGGKGLNVILNVDYTGLIHYPASSPTDGTRLGQYFTRLNGTATLAALSADTWTNNPAQEDIIQIIQLGGNICYLINYLLVAYGS